MGKYIEGVGMIKQWMLLDAFWFDYYNRTVFVIIPSNPHNPHWPNDITKLYQRLADNDGA